MGIQKKVTGEISESIVFFARICYNVTVTSAILPKERGFFRMNKAGTVAKAVVSAVVFLLCGLFIFRCCAEANRSFLSDITPNDALNAAYAANPDLTMITHDMPFEISADGYMTAYALVMIPEIAQVQITVRYNESIYEYNDLPAGADFTYTLTDSVTGQEIEAVPAEEDAYWMYSYRRLVFNGIALTDENNLTVAIYCGGEKITEELIHHADQNGVEDKPYKLSGKEKAALTGE